MGRGPGINGGGRSPMGEENLSVKFTRHELTDRDRTGKMFPSNGNAVLTPKGQRAVVVNDQNRSSIEVQFPDPEAGQRSECYRAEKLRPAPRLDDKALTEDALKNITTQVNRATKSIWLSSETHEKTKLRRNHFTQSSGHFSKTKVLTSAGKIL